MSAPSVGIVGGGILGLTAAYRLARRGVRVAVYEAAPDLGGLVGTFDLDGHQVDRFYHVVLPTDDRVIGLAEEVGVASQLRLRPVGAGFYDEGRLFSMTTPREFLTFPLLRMRDRLRLAAFVAWCQRRGSLSELDGVPLLPWLEERCGRRTAERLWRPLLDSKFDGRFHDLPASYIWARTRRMSATRERGREIMGWLPGGYPTLIEGLRARIEQYGGEVHAGTRVERITGDARDGATGLVVDGAHRAFDAVACTLLPPQARGLLDPELRAAAPEDHCRYLGVVCVVLRVDSPVSPYYLLNVTDRSIPLTTVVETTHVVDPAHVGGTLIYVARYVNPDNPDLTRDPEALADEYVAHAGTMLPELRRRRVLARAVQRARMVEPIHVLGGAANIPDMFPAPGLALASSVHVYPEVVNGQAVIGVADRLAEGLLARVRSVEAVAA
jgi:protoporphyrinogen oxidase